MHKLPELPYLYNALEPYIDEMTMEIHHTKHHQAYIDKLNSALEIFPDFVDLPIEELLRDIDALPEEIRTAVRNHGGGHHNHWLFWALLAPAGSPETIMSEAVKTEMITYFGSVEEMKESFKKEALARFGSGWVWIVRNNLGGLDIISTSNQDSPLSQGLFPILGLDVWEHAYYLKHQNRRAEYIDAFWNVVNWQTVENRLG